MNIDEFVEKFAEQMEDTDSSEITAETKFKDLPDWDSLTVLSVISMIKLDCGVSVSGLDVNKATTVTDIYELMEKANG